MGKDMSGFNWIFSDQNKDIQKNIQGLMGDYKYTPYDPNKTNFVQEGLKGGLLGDIFRQAGATEGFTQGAYKGTGIEAPEVGAFQGSKYGLGSFDAKTFDPEGVDFQKTKVAPVDMTGLLGQVKQREALTGVPVSETQISGIAKPAFEAKAGEAKEIARIDAQRKIAERKQAFTEFAFTEGQRFDEWGIKEGMKFSDFNRMQGYEADAFKEGRDREYEQWQWGEELNREDWAKGEEYRRMDYDWERAVEQGNHDMAENIKLKMMEINVDLLQSTMDRNLEKDLAVFGGESGGACIIVTQGYGEDSEELSITRQYRDKFLDKDTLRGYYMIAEDMVSDMKSDSEYMQYVKENLIDHWVAVGRHRLGITSILPPRESTVITDGFLNLCKVKGRSIKSFTRNNGEVI